MKKKKVPIIPIVVLAVLFGFVGYSNMPKGNPNQPAPPPDQKEDKKAEVATDVGHAMDEKSIKTVPGSAHGTSTLHPLERSSLIAPDPATFKLKPNNSSISSQWYEPNATKQ